MPSEQNSRPKPPTPNPTIHPAGASESRIQPARSALAELDSLEREFSEDLYDIAVKFTKYRGSQEITEADVRDAYRALLARGQKSGWVIAGQIGSRLFGAFGGALVGVGVTSGPSTNYFFIVVGIRFIIGSVAFDGLLQRVAHK
jgi:hypothetical protein